MVKSNLLSELWKLVKRDLRLSHWRETFFLGLANHLPRAYTADALRALVLKLAGMKIHYPAHIWAPLEIRPIGAASQICVGRDTFINSRARFAARHPATITIGERVLIGPDCMFETVNHHLHTDGESPRPAQPASILIEDDVWLGARVTVLPGVTIGRGSVIAAGAVVTGDVPPNTLVGGVPARPIRPLPSK